MIHTAPNVKKVVPSPQHPTGYAPVCIGTMISARMERFTRPLLGQSGVRLMIGKVGLGAGSCTSGHRRRVPKITAGRRALETTGIEAIEDVDLDELNPESLWRFRIRDFGPLRVAMDSHGGSLYAAVDADARARRAQALAALGVKS